MSDIKSGMSKERLFDAIAEGDEPDLVMQMLDASGLDVDVTDANGNSLLCAAARRGRLKTVRRLLHSGDDGSVELEYERGVLRVDGSTLLPTFKIMKTSDGLPVDFQLSTDHTVVQELVDPRLEAGFDVREDGFDRVRRRHVGNIVAG